MPKVSQYKISPKNIPTATTWWVVFCGLDLYGRDMSTIHATLTQGGDWEINVKHSWRNPAKSLYEATAIWETIPCFFWSFSPTARALGSSAIVKVSGQNCFWQIRLAPPEGSTEGSTGGSAKVPPKFFKFRGVSGSLGQIRFGMPKGSVEGSPITSLNLSPSSSTLFNIFSNSVRFGVFSHSKGLGAKWHVCLLGFFAANGFRLPKGSLECSPSSSLHWSHTILRFFGQMAVASEKVLWRVPPTILYHVLSFFQDRFFVWYNRFTGEMGSNHSSGPTLTGHGFWFSAEVEVSAISTFDLEISEFWLRVSLRFAWFLGDKLDKLG